MIMPVQVGYCGHHIHQQAHFLLLRNNPVLRNVRYEVLDYFVAKRVHLINFEFTNFWVTFLEQPSHTPDVKGRHTSVPPSHIFEYPVDIPEYKICVLHNLALHTWQHMSYCLNGKNLGKIFLIGKKLLTLWQEIFTKILHIKIQFSSYTSGDILWRPQFSVEIWRLDSVWREFVSSVLGCWAKYTVFSVKQKLTTIQDRNSWFTWNLKWWKV